MAIVPRAEVRQGAEAGLVKSTWGLEAGILQTTAKSLLLARFRFGLTLTGSEAYPDFF